MLFTCLTLGWLAAEELPLEVVTVAAVVVVAGAAVAALDEDPPPPLALAAAAVVEQLAEGGGGTAAASFLGLCGPAVSCGVLEGSTRTMIAILAPFEEAGPERGSNRCRFDWPRWVRNLPGGGRFNPSWFVYTCTVDNLTTGTSAPVGLFTLV